MMFARRIYLFSQREAQIENSKVHFVPADDFPRIKDMAILAGKQAGQYTAITNGDILIDPAITKLEQRLRFQNKRCASSRRWHFDPNIPMEQARLNASLGDDRGRDIFIARWDVWARIGREMPDKYRIGNCRWDAYLTDKFREHWNDGFVDFTSLRIIHHPIHGGRKRPYDYEIANAP